MKLPTEQTFLLTTALAACLVALAQTGCGRASSGETERVEVTDAASRTVLVRKPARSIVTLAPNLTELVYAAQAGDRLLAVSNADNYPPETASLRKISALPVDVESVVAMKPDIVLSNTEVNRVEDADRLTSLGVPVYMMKTVSIAEIFDGIRTIGELAGTEIEAAAHAELLESAVRNLRSLTDSLDKPAVLVLIGEEPMYSFGTGSYVHDLIDLAGGRSITADLPEAGPVLNEEYVISEDPEFVLGAFGDEYDPASFVQAHPAFAVLTAVREQQVISLHPDLLLRAGPRLIDGAYRIALSLHPGLFRDPNADVAVIE